MTSLTLRPATVEDVATLESWDRDPAVIACTTDDSGAEQAFGDHDWRVELHQQTDVSYFLIAECDGVPIASPGANDLVPDSPVSPLVVGGDGERASSSRHRLLLRLPASR